MLAVDKAEKGKEIGQAVILQDAKYIAFSYKNNLQVLTSAFGVNDRRQTVGSFEIDNSHQFVLGAFEASF